MKLINTLCLLFLFLFNGFISIAQDIGIGQWREHLPYYEGISVTEAENRIYCATRYSIFYFDKTDNSVIRLNKVTGLSDIGISTINYHTGLQTLVIAYSNTNIDLIRDNTITNISDIYRKSILGLKTINSVVFRDHDVYLACGFGIVVLDIEKEEIADTYYIGPEGSQINVYDLAFDENNNIYAATESGIYRASLNSTNLSDYNSWIKDMTVPHPDLTYNHIAYFTGNVFANNMHEEYDADTVFMYDGNAWQRFDAASFSTRKNIQINYDRMVIANNYNVGVFDETLTQIYLTYKPSDIGVAPGDATLDKDGFVWIADRFYGLLQTYNNGWSADVIRPNGPKSANVFDMSVGGKDLYVVPGGRDPSWGNTWKRGEVYWFIENSWDYLDYKKQPVLEPARDMLVVEVDPANNKTVFIGSWGNGLYEFRDNGLYEIYTDENSILQQFTGTGRINVGGLCFDPGHNLWITNSNAANLLCVKKNDGNWSSFNLGSVASGIDAGEIVIDSTGQKWILVRDHGLLVFNDNRTLEEPSDDQTRKLNANAGNGALPGLKILSFAVDQEGELWIGSDEGVAVIYSPGNVFTGGNYDAQRILVEQDGYIGYLLETESVTAIAIDGANRKWFGTDRAGVFLMSEDGTREILHFNEDNSPLLSHSITSIVINDDGEVFFGTSKGIISYKSTATPPPPMNTDVYAYPNPVREDYNGVIAIKGLVKNADVKITDVSGTLIYATRAEGGQAIWDGRNFDGRRAHTGVYLVFISNEDGSDTMVTKILFIN
ncbi:MAG: T9SS type A sorting domain-containing protein [Bacteroidales bacterium]|nr:T9SS type A sorting domain-containing protein [Bacteroidales bacterium]